MAGSSIPSCPFGRSATQIRATYGSSGKDVPVGVYVFDNPYAYEFTALPGAPLEEGGRVWRRDSSGIQDRDAPHATAGSRYRLH